MGKMEHISIYRGILIKLRIKNYVLRQAQDDQIANYR